jgi:hypothetical protein
MKISHLNKNNVHSTEIDEKQWNDNDIDELCRKWSNKATNSSSSSSSYNNQLNTTNLQGPKLNQLEFEPIIPATSNIIKQKENYQQHINNRNLNSLDNDNQYTHIQVSNLHKCSYINDQYYNVNDILFSTEKTKAINSILKQKLLKWMACLGMKCQMNAGVEGSSGNKIIINYENEWQNGIVLCELLGSILRLNKESVKEVKTVSSINKSLKGISRLVLNGTEMSIKSKAQVIRNFNLALTFIKTIPGLQDLTFLTSEILNGDIDVWNVIHEVYKVCGHKFEMIHNKSINNKSINNNSNNNYNKFRNDSNESNNNSNIQNLNKNHANEDALVDHKRNVHVSFSCDTEFNKYQNQLRNSIEIDRKNIHKNEHDKEKKKDNSSSSASSSPSSSESSSSPRKSRSTYPSSGIPPPCSPSPNTSHRKSRSTSPRSRKYRTSSSPKPRRRRSSTSPALSRKSRSLSPFTKEQQKPPFPLPEKRPSHYRGNRKVQAEMLDWRPPKLYSLDKATISKLSYPPITQQQQATSRAWLLTLGLSILDGEGGYYHSKTSDHLIQSMLAPPLPLTDDKLRNGELLCDLFTILESKTSDHVHLPLLIIRNPKSLTDSVKNIERALWLFKLRRCPPIPVGYLSQPQQILRGNKHILWGLLWELYQAYPASNINIQANLQGNNFGNNFASGDDWFSNNVNKDPASKPNNIFTTSLPRQNHVKFNNMTVKRGLNILKKNNKADLHRVPESSWWFHLPYSSHQRRLLDVSLIRWLQCSHILDHIINGLSIPTTLLELEGPVRDGSLFCMITESLIGLSIQTWNKRPLTYIQCIENVKKATASLRNYTSMSGRYLHNGVEEEIVRGNWDCVLGLLEDIHRCCNKCSPRHSIPTKEEWEHEGKQGPYTGTYNSTLSMGNSTVNHPEVRLDHNAKDYLTKNSSSLLNSQLYGSIPFSTDSLESSLQPPKEDNINEVPLDDAVNINKASNGNDWINNNGDEVRTFAEDIFPRVPVVNPLLASSMLLSQERVLKKELSPSKIPRYIDGNIPGEQYLWAQELSPPTNINSRSYRNEELKYSNSKKDNNATHDESVSLPGSSYGDESSDISYDSINNISNENTTNNNNKEINQSINKSIIKKSSVSFPSSPSRTISEIKTSSQRCVADLVKSKRFADFDVVINWLISINLISSSVLDLTVNEDEILSTNTCSFDIFGDFTILICKLMQFLERSAIIIPGFVSKPKNSAQRLNNLRIALELIATSNKRIPMSVLTCETLLFENNFYSIVKLLMALRKGYGYHLNKRY